ncbi:MAG: hypothetical protein GWN79_05675, partial [Actinobacteria bacterium]|nr:hypothetical protein [Actinomycetota bacterium]NIT94932.1 hypothetical protein [Actinomycetota bacterium]NIU18604.1 hypothetical protein [Actinomycetota bacterium]NIV55079.1 hypothetical protein [Actinomycetota bacterium]NIV86438.1 hypothetical protein [Actinomycetota bacterium]
MGAAKDADLGSASGSAYVFRRNDGGADGWGQLRKLTASDGAADDEYGKSVAISGDTVLIGAWHEADAGSDSGAAYVVTLAGCDWTEVDKPVAGDGAADDHFGLAVALDGDQALIGAPDDDDAGAGSGAAYLFQRNTGGVDTWGQVKKLTASDAAAGDSFGTAVALHGDLAVVGAPAGDAGGTADTGTAYVFERNQGGADNWGEVTELTASDAALSDAFGTSVALDIDHVVVGAPGDDGATGAIYVFERNQGGSDAWGQVQKRTAADAAAGDELGAAVGLSLDTIV